jgi:hypothetical protein
LVIAALGATSAMAQTQQPLSRAEVKAELARAQAAGDIDRNDLNYGTWWATSPSSKNYDKSFGAAPSASVADSSSATSSSYSGTGIAAGSSSMSPDGSSMGAAGRGYDGSAGMSSDSAPGTTGASSDNAPGTTGMTSGAAPSTTGMGSDAASSTSLQGSTSSSATGTTSTYSSDAAMGAAGRRYDGSSASGPANRADVAADRNAAMHSDRWIFNDLDGVRRLDPGENSHAGRVYKGPADAY